MSLLAKNHLYIKAMYKWFLDSFILKADCIIYNIIWKVKYMTND